MLSAENKKKALRALNTGVELCDQCFQSSRGGHLVA